MFVLLLFLSQTIKPQNLNPQIFLLSSIRLFIIPPIICKCKHEYNYGIIILSLPVAMVMHSCLSIHIIYFHGTIGKLSPRSTHYDHYTKHLSSLAIIFHLHTTGANCPQNQQLENMVYNYTKPQPLHPQFYKKHSVHQPMKIQPLILADVLSTTGIQG